MKNTLNTGLIALAFIALTASCATVKRISATQTTDLSGRWNDTDSRLVAEEMIQDVVNRPWRDKFINERNNLPVVLVGDILNKSHEHIEAETFIKDIERELINAKVARIVTHGVFKDKLRLERGDQQGNVAPETQKQFGRELGADFMLFGTINAIVDTKAAGRRKVVLYQINLELVDLETNEVVWIGDKKIKKYIKK